MTPYKPNDEITIRNPNDTDGSFLDVTVINHYPLTDVYLVDFNGDSFLIEATDIVELD